MKGKIVIARELCKGCKYCVISCPKGAITVEKQFNKMGYFPAQFENMDRCTGCGFCAQMCPELAIEVWVMDNNKNNNKNNSKENRRSARTRRVAEETEAEKT